jgi:hypothetical protein
VKIKGIGLCLAIAFFVAGIAWVGCEHFEERQCREKELVWNGRECVEP